MQPSEFLGSQVSLQPLQGKRPYAACIDPGVKKGNGVKVFELRNGLVYLKCAYPHNIYILTQQKEFSNPLSFVFLTFRKDNAKIHKGLRPNFN